MTNLHEIEELDFGRDGRLWDADPDVCCAAWQLGACPHTEAADGDYEMAEAEASPWVPLPVAPVADNEEPF